MSEGGLEPKTYFYSSPVQDRSGTKPCGNFVRLDHHNIENFNVIKSSVGLELDQILA